MTQNDQPPSPSIPALLLPLALVAGVLLLLPRAPSWLEPWLRISLPNLVLLGGSLLLRSRMSGDRPMFLAGVRRSWTFASITLLLGGLVLVFARLWPREWVELPAGELVLRVLVMGLVPPCEEAYFRGVLLSSATARWNSGVAAGATSLLFGLMHWPQGRTVMGVMVGLSLLACLVVSASRTVIWAMAIHAGWNALAMLVDAPQGGQRWLLAGAGAALVAAFSALGLVRRSAATGAAEQRREP